MAKRYAKISNLGKNLYKKYLPGALTIISELKPKTDLSSLITNNNRIEIRIPNEEKLINLIEAIKIPLTIVNANMSNYSTIFSLDTFINTTPEDKLDIISFFISKGKLNSNQVSTIVDTTNNKLEILRQGFLLLK